MIFKKKMKTAQTWLFQGWWGAVAGAVPSQPWWALPAWALPFPFSFRLRDRCGEFWVSENAAITAAQHPGVERCLHPVNWKNPVHTLTSQSCLSKIPLCAVHSLGMCFQFHSLERGRQHRDLFFMQFSKSRSFYWLLKTINCSLRTDLGGTG